MEAPILLKTVPVENNNEWKAVVAQYKEPEFWRAVWQLFNTLGPYLLLWFLIYLSLQISWLLTIPLSVLAAGLLTRIFIIFHDCGHGSFFKSPRANAFFGFVTGMLTFTPYYYWRWQHALHHKSSGDLDGRGIGDIWTLTVREYLELSSGKRLAYRLVRNPVVLFVLAPFFLLLFKQRFSMKAAPRRERYSVWWINLAIIAISVSLSLIYGWLPYLIIQLAIPGISGSAGIWLFYVQHQFEGVYWERREKWDFTAAALQGSSYYKLPKILQWFSGNIGFHHIHHLSPRIPNYKLEKCHRSKPMFQELNPITVKSSLRSLKFRLWDESAKKIVVFRLLIKHA